VFLLSLWWEERVGTLSGFVFSGMIGVESRVYPLWMIIAFLRPNRKKASSLFEALGLGLFWDLTAALA